MSSSRRFIVIVVFMAVVLELAGGFGGASPAAASGPVATAASNVDGIEVDLLSIERKGNVLTIKWAVRNQASAKREVLFALTGTSVTTFVVDEENGTKYYALTDQEGNVLATEHEWVSSGTYGIKDEVGPGGTKRFWAKLPAPPPEVKKLTVFFSEAEPLEDVTIRDVAP